MKRFAIVGCGRVAQKHAENIAMIAELKAVCDIVPERADAFATAYQAKAYTSLEELLEKEKEVDVIVVCTPNGLHAEHIIKSLQAGKDVLCEKPMCLTKAAAWQIIETEKFCRRKLYLVKSARYNPIIQRLKEIIDSRGIGEIYSFHLNCIWNRDNAYYTDWKGKVFPDGGTLYNQFSHFIDVMVWLFGDVSEVKGFSANKAHKSSIEYEDSGAVALEMQNGILGSFHWSVNAFRNNFEISLSVIAQKGTIKIGGVNLNEVQYLQTEDNVAFPLIQKEHRGNHHEIYEHLAKVWSQQAGQFPDAFDGLRTVETIENIYKAIA